MKIFKISAEEKTIQYIYLICLWVLFSTVFVLIFFNNHTHEEIQGAKLIVDRIEEKKSEQHDQIFKKKHIDTLRLLLSQYTQENNQSYIESSISYELNEIKKSYDHTKKEQSISSIYYLTNIFYSTLFYDKKATWNTINNCDFLKKNLSECEIGFQQNQNNITLQEALQITDKKE